MEVYMAVRMLHRCSVLTWDCKAWHISKRRGMAVDACPSWMALHSAPSSTGPNAWAAALPAPGPCRIL